jgi:hypothetical protein
LDYLALDRSGDTLSGGETQRIRLAVQLGPEAGSEGDLIWASDYVIDLGPGSGDKGGRVVAEGAPDEVVRQPTTSPTNFRPRAPVKILDSGFRQNARKKPCPTSCATVEKGMTRSVTGCYSETSSVQFSRSLSVIVQNCETDAVSETASVWMPRINISA